ncbi:hypothetical protein [Reichenbachiella sp.]|uniref:hypothetical protein n=1 Tax=Reichenbachiella sp. TaxID=2184521 RepID=UPI003BB17BD7
MSKWIQLSGNLYDKENRSNEVKITRERGTYFLNLKVEIKTNDELPATSNTNKRKHQDNYRKIQLDQNIIGEPSVGEVVMHKNDVENTNGVTLTVSMNAIPKVPHFGSNPIAGEPDSTKKS